MANRLELAVEVQPLSEGGYLALCPEIAGCHAEGKTMGQALDNLRDVAQVIYELCQEKDLTFVENHPHIKLNNIVWKVDIPLARPT